MGEIVGLYHGLVSAIADTIYEALGGYLMVRTTAPYTAGDAAITVESTFRFPDAGRLAIDGYIVEYTGKTDTSFTGLTYEGAVGLPEDQGIGTVVMDWSRASTQLDLLRRSFLVDYADGTDLDTLGRNHGLARPRGANDATYRALLRVLMYLDAQTPYAMRRVLDVLYGAGNYELYEDLISDPLTVHVVMTSSAGSPAGKTYLIGGEEQASAGDTVTVNEAPAVVYGVYDAADRARTGTNYLYATLTVTTQATSPASVFSAGRFESTDEGRPIIIDGQSWTIRTFISANEIVLATRTRDDGRVNSGEPTVFRTDADHFRPWMVGHALVVSSEENGGTYEITEYVSPFEVKCASASFGNESGVTWWVQPQFATGSTTAHLLRHSVAGKVITCPGALPANVRVDYATVRSAELMEDVGQDGTDAGPFYLWDAGWLARVVLDLVRAAGVRVVVES